MSFQLFRGCLAKPMALVYKYLKQLLSFYNNPICTPLHEVYQTVPCFLTCGETEIPPM